MTTDAPLRDRDHVAEVVRAVCFPDAATADRVGLELELFPVRRTDAGVHRVPLAGREGTWDLLRAAAPGRPSAGTSSLPLEHGGVLTAEPGGQLELSACVEDDVDTALDRLADATSTLARTLAPAGIDLLSAGTDQWCDRTGVPQQLDRPRYRAMDAGLAARGPWGRVMMRHTASMQVNLDPGGGTRTAERWGLALLLGPICSATFAASPADVIDPDGAWSAVGERTVAWQRLDPSRTGTPAAFVAGEDDPVVVMTDAALRADVLFVLDGDDATPGAPGWTFRDWLLGEGPRGVTEQDLGTHLSTLFHDVRPRGPLELRAVDALPWQWRDVPAVLLTAALYDDEVRDRLTCLLQPWRSELPALSHRAAVSGVRDPELCAVAVEVWSLALAAAARLGVSARRRATCEAFLEQFTLRGLTVADALADDDPAARVARCLEPRPSFDVVES